LLICITLNAAFHCNADPIFQFNADPDLAPHRHANLRVLAWKSS
jgi:hypothetical protein